MSNILLLVVYSRFFILNHANNNKLFDIFFCVFFSMKKVYYDVISMFRDV